MIAGAGSNSTSQAIELSQGCRSGRRRRRPVGRALLQQADAGGDVRAFSRDRRIDRPPDHPLRRPRAHRMRPGGRHHRAAGGTSAIHRSQGRDRRCRAAAAPAVIGGVGVSIAVGDDATALAFFAQGGDGCISVTSNVVPGLCRALYLAWTQGQIAQAQQLATAAARVTAALRRESDPAPVKYALSTMDLVSPRVRLPLVELKSESRAEIDAVLARVCEKYPGYLIGKLARRDQTSWSAGQPGRPQRKFAVVS